MKILDLKALTVTADDAAKAAATFRENFGFDMIGEDGARTILAIGPAGIEFAPASGGGRGLVALTLRVESLARAEETLRARGLVPEQMSHSGKAALAVGPAGTHGARLIFVEG